MTARASLILVGLSLAGAARAQKALILSDAKVSPAAQEIAFSAAKGSGFSVYEQALLAEGKAVRISQEVAGFDCFAPAYSPDGQYLLYLKQPRATTKESNYADVVLYDRQRRTSQQLTTGQQNIRQALFSADGTRIVYIAAGFFGSYSPVGPKAAHELDLHSMALDGSSRVQHTHLKAYLLGNLALLQAPNTYLLNINDPRQKLSGTYVYSFADSTSFKLVKDKIADEHQLSYLPNLTTSSRKTVVYSIGDELFVKSMKTGSSENVYTGPMRANPHPMDFVGTQNAIVFSETLRESPQATSGVFRISLLNLDDLKVVPIPIRLD